MAQLQMVAPDMGAYEAPDASALPLQVAFTGAPLSGVTTLDVTLTPATAGGDQTIVWHGWDFDNNGTYDQEGGALSPVVHTFGVGHHTVRLAARNASGETAEATRTDYVHVAPADIYVAASGSNTVPYDSWAKAAHTIQDAVDEALSGCTINVGAGTYPVTKSVDLFSNVDLIGAGDPADAIISRDAAGGNFRVITTKGAGVDIANITIANGNGTLNGGGVYMVPGTTMANCVVTGCSLTGKYFGNAVYADNADISNCTFIDNDYSQAKGVVVMTGGSTITDSTIEGCLFQTYGALYLMGNGNVAERCLITNNTTGQYGQASGALIEGTSSLRNSLIHHNTSSYNSAGVKITGGTILNCTIADNVTTSGGTGGLYRTGGTVKNTIAYGNSANSLPLDYNGDLTAITYSCAPELTSGTGNVTGDPLFNDSANGDYQLPPTSPCIDTATSVAEITVDIDGTARPLDGNGDGSSLPDMGAYEAPEAVGLPLAVSFSGSPVKGLTSLTVTFTINLVGSDTDIVSHEWDWDNDGTADETGGAIGTTVDHTFSVGHHSVTLTVRNAGGEEASSTILDMIHVAPVDIYVSDDGSNTVPYDTLAKGAHGVQAAVAEALDGCTIHVEDGIYAVSSEVALNKQLTLRGIDGPDGVAIVGDGTHRIINMSVDNTVLENLTIRNGYVSGGERGGGVLLTADGIIRNCVIEDCSASGHGDSAGVSMTGGYMSDSVVQNCRTSEQGTVHVEDAVIEDCHLINNFPKAQGALELVNGTARRLTITGNTGGVYSTGGATLTYTFGSNPVMENSLIADNSTAATNNTAGGVMLSAGSLINCTVVNNSIVADTSGGINRNGGTVVNTIVAGNTANGLPVDYSGDLTAITYSCAPELTVGTGNITDAPVFKDAVNGDYRQAPTSPTIDAGSDAAAASLTTDLAGDSRIQGLQVDMGAYEAPPVPVVNSLVVADSATGNRRSTSGTVDITIEATAGVATATVTGYMVTQSDVQPAAGDGGWGVSNSITDYFISGTPDSWVTLYAWVKDSNNEVGGASTAIYYYDSSGTAPQLLTGPSFAVVDADTVNVSWTTDLDAVGEIRYRKTTETAWTYADCTTGVATSHSAPMTVAPVNNYEVYLLCNGTEFGPYYCAVDADGRAPEDVNNQGGVTLADMTFVRNRINKNRNADDNWSADVNNDGRINILDLVKVRNAM